jgi:hypothetical protein
MRQREWWPSADSVRKRNPPKAPAPLCAAYSRTHYLSAVAVFGADLHGSGTGSRCWLAEGVSDADQYSALPLREVRQLL